MAGSILLFCGPPGAGKTTLATRVRGRLAGTGRRFRIVHSDEFSRRTYERMYERVAEEGGDWILDGTFYRRGWRERFRDVGDVRVIHVTASLDTCLERNRERADAIDERGVHVIYREFEEPDADLAIDTDETSVEDAVGIVEQGVDRWFETA